MPSTDLDPTTPTAADAEMTAQQAADLLNVSLPYLIALVENGVLRARMAGHERRLLVKDVHAYKGDNEAKRREALQDLAKLDQELGLR